MEQKPFFLKIRNRLQKKFKKKLTMQRARYPEKRKSDGEFFVEKECPSCGATFSAR